MEKKMTKHVRKREPAWFAIDLNGIYSTEIFTTQKEAESYRRGISYAEGGEFVIVHGFYEYFLPLKGRGRK